MYNAGLDTSHIPGPQAHIKCDVLQERLSFNYVWAKQNIIKPVSHPPRVCFCNLSACASQKVGHYVTMKPSQDTLFHFLPFLWYGNLCEGPGVGAYTNKMTTKIHCLAKLSIMTFHLGITTSYDLNNEELGWIGLWGVLQLTARGQSRYLGLSWSDDVILKTQLGNLTLLTQKRRLAPFYFSLCNRPHLLKWQCIKYWFSYFVM